MKACQGIISVTARVGLCRVSSVAWLRRAAVCLGSSDAAIEDEGLGVWSANPWLGQKYGFLECHFDGEAGYGIWVYWWLACRQLWMTGLYPCVHKGLLDKP